MNAGKAVRACVVAAVFMGTLTSVHAAPISWNTWKSATTGTIPLGPVSVAFTAGGSTDFLVSSYPSYAPTTTFSDGSLVDNGPLSSNNIIQLKGGNSHVNTVTFSVPVVNPVMAIWSLGQSGIKASFNFDAAPTFVAGGPSAEYGGTPITVSGNSVFGIEGNGTVQFAGTFLSISWTNPVFEDWYGFNVGIANIVGPEPHSPVPEPETYGMLLAGLTLVAALARRSKRTQ